MTPSKGSLKKVLTYIGMVGGAGILIYVVLATFGFFYFIYSVFIAPNTEYYRGRFLITATVEVDGVLKSGSSVYEVAYNRLKRGSPGAGSPIIGARGTMPVIDLGELGWVVLSFDYTENRGLREKVDIGELKEAHKCRNVGPSRLPTSTVVLPQKRKYNFREVLNVMKRKDAVFDTSGFSITAFISDREYNKKTNSFDFCVLDIFSDGKMKPVEISIEKTQQPIETQHPHPEFLGGFSVWRSKFLP